MKIITKIQIFEEKDDNNYNDIKILPQKVSIQTKKKMQNLKFVLLKLKISTLTFHLYAMYGNYF